MIGRRVVRKGWEKHEKHAHLARRGTITSEPILEVGYPLRVEVRWDAGHAPLGKPVPPRVEIEPVAELSWLWWRST